MAGGGSSCVGIDRTSSIEFEPRTLDIRQIQFAREAAMLVLNTKSMEEAFQIFTQGLEPVKSVAKNADDDRSETEIEDSGEDEHVGDGRVFGNQIFRPTPSPRRCKDVSTAPF